MPNLINTLINTVLGIIVYCSAIGHLCNVIQAYNNIQRKLECQQEKLITRHLIAKDLFMTTLNVSTCKVGTNTCNGGVERENMMPLSDVLILHTLHHDIIYSLRKSAIHHSKQIIKYALYRDDTMHQSQAVVENIKSLTVQIATLAPKQQIITIAVGFSDNYILNITCTLPH